MVPRSSCSFRNFPNSCCSDCESRILRLMRVAGAPGFSSIAWSQGHGGGNFLDSSSLNTLAYFRYCGGTMLSGVCIAVLPTMVWDLGLICRGKNRAFAASADRRTIGSWLCVIHPLAQSILGCAAANQG